MVLWPLYNRKGHRFIEREQSLTKKDNIFVVKGGTRPPEFSINFHFTRWASSTGLSNKIFV